MPIPAFDLKLQYAEIGDEIEAAVQQVLRSTQYILGPHVSEFEGAMADYTGAAHAVGVSSGSDALLVAMMSEGIGAGDEVVTTAYSFFATAGSIARLGARPVLVDIDPVTYNVDVAAMNEACTERTRAVMPVHLYGQMADMPAIVELAKTHGAVVIEDAAQAIGARISGRSAGSWGDIGCFSFYPTKNLGAAGDGGLVTTGDAERAEHLRVLRAHGSKPKYFHHEVGGNFRLDALQAAILQVKLRHLDRWIERRRGIAAHYAQRLGAFEELTLPSVADEHFHVYHQFVVRHPRRDALRAHLSARGIGTGIYYPRPFHLQQCFEGLGYGAGDFPESEGAAEQTLALPMFPELTQGQVDEVCDNIRDFCVG